MATHESCRSRDVCIVRRKYEILSADNGVGGKIDKSHKYLGTLIGHYTIYIKHMAAWEKVYESSAGGEHEHSPHLTPIETVQTWQSNINTMYQVSSAKYWLCDSNEPPD